MRKAVVLAVAVEIAESSPRQLPWRVAPTTPNKEWYHVLASTLGVPATAGRWPNRARAVQPELLALEGWPRHSWLSHNWGVLPSVRALGPRARSSAFSAPARLP